MRLPEKRKVVMKRSMALGHCVCNPKQPCPCTILIEQDLCPCAGERPDPEPGEVRLTRHVRKAGCASKIGRKDLEEILKELPADRDPNVLVGVAAGDDAGVYKLPGEFNLVQTVDVFSPIVDDAYLFGQICAVNSVSDIYAMGGRPICALSIVGFPIEQLPRSVMVEILRGGIDKMREAGVAVVGGHSINDEELKAGFAVSGLVKGTGAITNSGARPGDRIVLTKPLGTGLVSFAAQLGVASEEAVELIGCSMAELNRDGAELMLEHGATACTDVTGFSLLGHLSNMARYSGLTARVELSKVPVFAEAIGCIRQEIIPGAVERNRESFSEFVEVVGESESGLLDLLYDAQTSGGLLVALPEEPAEKYIEAMRSRGHEATCEIGAFFDKREHAVEVLVEEPQRVVGTYRVPPLPEQIASLEPTQSASLACCEDMVEEFSCCDHPPEDIEINEQKSTVEMEEKPMSDQTQNASDAFKNMMKTAMTPGKVDARAKRLAAIALSISQRCEACFLIHTRNALKEGIGHDEIEEMAWVATSFTGCTGRMFYQEMMKKLEA